MPAPDIDDLLDEQQARWERGDQVPVESFLRGEPDETDVILEHGLYAVLRETLFHGKADEARGCGRGRGEGCQEGEDCEDPQEVITAPAQRAHHLPLTSSTR